MPEQLRSTVSVFSSAGGHWLTDRAVNVRAVEPAPDLPAAQRGDLYVLVEIVAGQPVDRLLYRQLLDAAQAAFYGMGDSVDVAMRQAARSVHTLLHRANEVNPAAGLRAGMSLAMRYAQHLIVAQAGPAFAVVSHADGVDQFPDRMSRWTPALGGEERAEVALYETTVEPGAIVILGQSTWPQRTKPETLAIASMAADVSLATQYLGQMAGDAELSAILIGFDLDIPSVRNDAKPSLAPQPAPAPPPTERPRGGLFGGRKLFGQGRPADEGEDAGAGHAPAPGAQTERATGDGVPPPWVEPDAPEWRTASPGGGPAALRAPATPPAPPRAEPPPLHVAPAENVPLPADLETPAAPPRAAPRRSVWPLVLALVVLPLLIIAVVVGMLLVRTEAAQAQFDEKIGGAQNVIAQAEMMTDDAAASAKLVEARDYLDAAQALRPNDVRLTEAQAAYDAVLNRVEKITPLYGIVPLWEFKSDGRKLTRVIAGGDSLFVLDQGRHEVQRFIRSPLGDSVTPANETAAPLFARGAALGDKAVGDLVDMTWGPAATANQRSLLLTLDANRTLVGYDAVYGVKTLALGGTDQWVQGQLIAGYGGNFYVADTGANQIWRYRPEGEGYAGAPEPYFKNPNNLAGLQSIAIDGNIWLLFSDGRLLRFLNGEQPQFSVQGLPNDFSNPVALAAPQEGNRLYVADPGNARIVELTKEGQFVRQFKAREGDILKEMVHLFLDEAGGMFYILTPDHLYGAYVPDATPAAGANTPAS